MKMQVHLAYDLVGIYDECDAELVPEYLRDPVAVLLASAYDDGYRMIPDYGQTILLEDKDKVIFRLVTVYPQWRSTVRAT